MGRFIELCFKHGLDSLGKSYGQFLAGGEPLKMVLSGTKTKRRSEFHPDKVHEVSDFSFLSGKEKAYTWTKAARYSDQPYETGPLARQVLSRNRRIYPLYKKFGDSFMVRVLARMEELLTLILDVNSKLDKIDLKEDSWIEPPIETKKLSGKGVGVVEAARGTLIHKLEVSSGRITKYDIITPTVWNLGSRDEKFLGVVEKAIVGLTSEKLAYTILRSFDVCSVCTTH
jgi:Ni,Fe-hydrogenase I large subunit